MAGVPDRGLRAALFLRLDGRPVDLLLWRLLRPEATDPFAHEQEN